MDLLALFAFDLIDVEKGIDGCIVKAYQLTHESPNPSAFEAAKPHDDFPVFFPDKDFLRLLFAALDPECIEGSINLVFPPGTCRPPAGGLR